MKRALKIVGIVVVVILLAVIALPFLINVNSFRPKLESELSTALGRQVKVGNLSLSILSGSVSAEDLSISDDPAFSKDCLYSGQVAEGRRGSDAADLFQDPARHRHHARPAGDFTAARRFGKMEFLQPGQQLRSCEEAGGADVFFHSRIFPSASWTSRMAACR